MDRNGECTGMGEVEKPSEFEGDVADESDEEIDRDLERGVSRDFKRCSIGWGQRPDRLNPRVWLPGGAAFPWAGVHPKSRHPGTDPLHWAT